MNELELTGGARIGMANVFFPFAALRVNKERLELNASIIGGLTFQPSDILSIEPYTSIPLIGRGVKINHRVEAYKEKVIFWTFQNPKSVVEQINKTGFLDQKNMGTQSDNKSIKTRQAQGGNPAKKGFTIGAVVLWNLFFLFDIIPFFMGKSNFPFGNGVRCAVILIFLTALLTLVSGRFRELVLKEGRELSDVKKFAILILFISAFFFFNLLFIARAANI